MKKNLSLAFTLVFALFVSNVQAGHLTLQVATTDNGAGNYVSVVTLLGLSEDDNVTAMSIEVVPADPTGNPFLNYDTDGRQSFVPIAAGADFSFTNAFLGVAANEGGRGWTIIDGTVDFPAPSGPEGIGYAISSPGSNLVADSVFLNNVVLAGAGTFSVRFATEDGLLPGHENGLSTQVGVPEPGTLALAGLSLAGVMGVRRRRSC